MLKNSPIILAGGIVAALLLSGCNKGNDDSADSTPPPTPVRPAKPNAGAPGMGAKPAPGAPGSPDTNKGTQTAAKPVSGKTDPFAPKGADKAGGKMQAKGKAGADKGKTASAKGAGTGTPAPATPLGAAGTGLTGTPPAPGTPGTPAAPAPGTKVASIAKHPEIDPFKVTWHKMPPPPYVFESVQPLRLASAEVEIPPAGEVNVREVATRRVSGIMSGDGVFAILEGAEGGDPEIVKPGFVTRDGYRVVSITSDSVKLQRKDGNVIRTQIVPLTDASTSQTSSGLFGGRGGFPGAPGSGGFPGGSGGFPGGSGGPRPGGSGGFPGAPRGKRGGAGGALGPGGGGAD